MVAKVLLQELCSRGYEWGDEVMDEVATRIEDWFEQLKSRLSTVKITRCLRNTLPVKSKQVVTFVDASQQAYRAAAYLRCEYENGSVTRLIAAKSKVAPLTLMTVPRLELVGAFLGLRLTQSLFAILGAPIQRVTFYSDSTDVLWCIRGRGRLPTVRGKSNW